MKRGAVEAGGAHANIRRDLGESVIARRQEIEVAGVCHEMVLRWLRQVGLEDVAEPGIGVDLVVRRVQSCTGTVTAARACLVKAGPRPGAAMAIALTRGS